MIIKAATAITLILQSDPTADAAGNTVTNAQFVFGGGAVNAVNTPVNLGKNLYSLLLDVADVANPGYLQVVLRNASPVIVGWTDLMAVSFDPLGANYGGGGSDPWATPLPGAYIAGEAGYIVGHNIDALISSRSAPGDNMDLVNAPNATALNAAADALLNRTNGIETGATPKQALRAIAAAVAGVLAISGTTVTISGLGVGTTRLTATCDTQGQRTVVTPSL